MKRALSKFKSVDTRNEWDILTQAVDQLGTRCNPQDAEDYYREADILWNERASAWSKLQDTQEHLGALYKRIKIVDHQLFSAKELLNDSSKSFVTESTAYASNVSLKIQRIHWSAAQFASLSINFVDDFLAEITGAQSIPKPLISLFCNTISEHKKTIAQVVVRQQKKIITDLEEAANHKEQDAIQVERSESLRIARDIHPPPRGCGQAMWRQWAKGVVAMTGGNAESEPLIRNMIATAEVGAELISEKAYEAWQQRVMGSYEELLKLQKESKREVAKLRAELQPLLDQEQRVLKSFQDKSRELELLLLEMRDLGVGSATLKAGEDGKLVSTSETKGDELAVEAALFKRMEEITKQWIEKMSERIVSEREADPVWEQLYQFHSSRLRLEARAKARLEADLAAWRNVWPKRHGAVKPYAEWDLPFTIPPQPYSPGPPTPLMRDAESLGRKRLHQARLQIEAKSNLTFTAEKTQEGATEPPISPTPGEWKKNALEATDPTEALLSWTVKQVTNHQPIDLECWELRAELERLQENEKEDLSHSIPRPLLSRSKSKAQIQSPVRRLLKCKSWSGSTPDEVSTRKALMVATDDLEVGEEKDTSELDQHRQNAYTAWKQLVLRREEERRLRGGQPFTSHRELMYAWGQADQRALELQRLQEEETKLSVVATMHQINWKENTQRWEQRWKADEIKAAEAEVDQKLKECDSLNVSTLEWHEIRNELMEKQRLARHLVKETERRWEELVRNHKEFIGLAHVSSADLHYLLEREQELLLQMKATDRAVIHRCRMVVARQLGKDPEEEAARSKEDMDYPHSLQVKMQEEAKVILEADSEQVAIAEVTRYRSAAKTEAVRAAREQIPHAEEAWMALVRNSMKQSAVLAEANKAGLTVYKKECRRLDEIQLLLEKIFSAKQERQLTLAREAAEQWSNGRSRAWEELGDEVKSVYETNVEIENKAYCAYVKKMIEKLRQLKKTKRNVWSRVLQVGKQSERKTKTSLENMDIELFRLEDEAAERAEAMRMAGMSVEEINVYIRDKVRLRRKAMRDEAMKIFLMTPNECAGKAKSAEAAASRLFKEGRKVEELTAVWLKVAACYNRLASFKGEITGMAWCFSVATAACEGEVSAVQSGKAEEVNRLQRIAAAWSNEQLFLVENEIILRSLIAETSALQKATISEDVARCLKKKIETFEAYVYAVLDGKSEQADIYVRVAVTLGEIEKVCRSGAIGAYANASDSLKGEKKEKEKLARFFKESGKAFEAQATAIASSNEVEARLWGIIAVVYQNAAEHEKKGNVEAARCYRECGKAYFAQATAVAAGNKKKAVRQAQIAEVIGNVGAAGAYAQAAQHDREGNPDVAKYFLQSGKAFEAGAAALAAGNTDKADMMKRLGVVWGESGVAGAEATAFKHEQKGYSEAARCFKECRKAFEAQAQALSAGDVVEAERQGKIAALWGEGGAAEYHVKAAESERKGRMDLTTSFKQLAEQHEKEALDLLAVRSAVKTLRIDVNAKETDSGRSSNTTSPLPPSRGISSSKSFTGGLLTPGNRVPTPTNKLATPKSKPSPPPPERGLQKTSSVKNVATLERLAQAWKSPAGTPTGLSSSSKKNIGKKEFNWDDL